MSDHVLICTTFWLLALGFVVEFLTSKNPITLLINILLGVWALVLTGWLS